MLLQANTIVKSYGIQNIFEIKNLVITENDRIGLVGKNGAGKSTLLSVLSGEMEPDEGYIERNCRPAVIRQTGEADGDAEGRMLKVMDVKEGPVKSGGEVTRMAIAAAFSQNAPLLFADEPTTNLDIEGIETLEKMLLGYRGALVLVSHDRELLDKVCTTIWELDNGSLRVFPGRYSDWVEQKEREYQFAQFEYEQYRSEKHRLEQAMYQIREEAKVVTKAPRKMSNSEWQLYKNGAATKQKRVQNRSKVIRTRVEAMEVKEKPAAMPKVMMNAQEAEKITGRTAVRVKGLTWYYGEHLVLDDVEFNVPTGKTTVMIGPNGEGKTTAAKYMLEGGPSLITSPGVIPGYFSQHGETLDPKKTVLENIKAGSCVPEHFARTIIANLRLSRDDLEKKVSTLSGGERAKTALAKLLTSGANLLILDEPTNHIDVYTMEALESLLSEWEITMLLITHDRRLIGKTADRLLIVKDKKIQTFEGTWSEYEEQRERTSEKKVASGKKEGHGRRAGSGKKQGSSKTPDALQKQQVEIDPMRETLLEMRLAELAAKLNQQMKAAEKEKLEQKWQETSEELSRIKEQRLQ